MPLLQKNPGTLKHSPLPLSSSNYDSHLQSILSPNTGLAKRSPYYSSLLELLTSFWHGKELHFNDIHPFSIAYTGMSLALVFTKCGWGFSQMPWFLSRVNTTFKLTASTTGRNGLSHWSIKWYKQINVFGWNTITSYITCHKWDPWYLHYFNANCGGDSIRLWPW